EQQMYSIGAKRAGIDPNVIKELFLRKDPAEALADLAELQKTAGNQGMGSVSMTLGPTGPTYKVGQSNSGGRAIQTGELFDAQATGIISPKLQDAGFKTMEQVNQAANLRKTEERARLQLSERGADRADTALAQLRPDESKKLEAYVELHRSATDMLG